LSYINQLKVLDTTEIFLTDVTQNSCKLTEEESGGVNISKLEVKRDYFREFWTESMVGTPVILCWFLRRNI